MARVSSIPSGVAFVDALAQGLLAEAEGDALALADMLVLLPNRRACRSLRDAFWKAGGGAALALPAIQPIGDLDPDELPFDAECELDLPPAIGKIRRRLLLIRLLEPLGWTTDQAGRLADDLAELLDELQTERVSFEALEQLVPAMFADHWQQSLTILQVVSHHWPAVLEEEGALDPAERRHRILSAFAERWEAVPPTRRIVAAGSTGSIPATRHLLKVIAALPNGEVVLPGLDRWLDDLSWDALTPQHPQYSLKQLLTVLEIERQNVQLWPQITEADARPRPLLLREVMKPSGMADGLQPSDGVRPEALLGLTLAEHPDPAIEATAIALRLRAALLEEGRTAALITPDRALARRVVVELRRFGIVIDDSAGVPLDRTAPGGFLLLTAKLVLDEIRPVALLSVLKHPLMRAGLDVDLVRARARALDRLCLRGPAIMGGFREIIGELNDRSTLIAERSGEQAAERELVELRDWLESLAGMAAPFAALAGQGSVSLGELVSAHLRFAEALAAVDGNADGLWAKEAGEAAASLFRELLEAADAKDSLPPVAYPGLLAQQMAASPVRPRRPTHPRLAIYGQLEARLQQTDLTILAGLNEGVWPRNRQPGPWLNPAMRQSLGLPPLERMIGQAAHDFVQTAAGGEVMLSRARKDVDGGPAVPSRWLVRLKALLAGSGEGAAIEESSTWQDWAQSLDLPNVIRAEQQPKPKPPLPARPRKLSVSDVGLWMNNAYGLYAKRILKLTPLEALEADPGAGDRGTIIHEALERFVRAFPKGLPDDPRAELLASGRKAFAGFSQRPQVQALWWPRFLEAASWVIAREEGLRADISTLLVEVSGELEIEAPLGLFRLTARADRLEQRLDGGVVIVDYKTGKPPSAKEIALGLAPQLPLEGAILKAGGFGNMGGAGLADPSASADPVDLGDLADLQFWQLSGDDQGGRLERRPCELVDAALEGLEALIHHYDQASTAYPAAYRPPTARRGDYDHLARLGEWPN